MEQDIGKEEKTAEVPRTVMEQKVVEEERTMKREEHYSHDPEQNC